MQNAGLPKPTYDIEGMFNITLRRKPTTTPTISDLTDLGKSVLDLMGNERKPTVDELCKRVGRKKSTIYKVLKNLRDKGCID